jgi:hypothetical protein
MKIAGRAAAQCRSRLSLLWLALFCASALLLSAQSPGIPAAAPHADSAVSSPPAKIHGVLSLDGPWRFHTGDDPRWADPTFDDSAWPSVTLDQPLSGQGIDPYSGYAWYRIRLQPAQLSQVGRQPGSTSLDVLVTGSSVGQLAAYVNGVESGQTCGMTERPSMYQSQPFVVRLANPGGDRDLVLAIRTWIGPGVPVQHGILGKVELGAPDDIAERLTEATSQYWDRHLIADLIVGFLFFCVALLGATLYLAQRHHSEYLWLALLCLSVALSAALESVFGLALLPFSIFNVLNLWIGRVFMAVTLEFVLRFTGRTSRNSVRTVQIFVLLIPFVSLVHLAQIYDFLLLVAEIVFLVLISVLLFRAWRRGLKEAGVMLLPFLLVATSDSLNTIFDYATAQQGLSGHFNLLHFQLGPIEFSAGTASYTIFLASLIAVILYRFVSVSQEEQRSAAEIEAARSVQALLIPTHLPSNRHFIMESAYLPVNAVGGDFFQVLPLQDESLLVVVGDVSGKGLQAAMSASTLVGALRNELSHDPATVLNRLNRVLLGATSGPAANGSGSGGVASFATCLCARIYPDGSMTIANAGHLSPYRDGREMELPPGLPLGIVAGIQYEQAAFRLNRGERLIFLSDGVVEAMNPQGELFGFERTQQISNEPALYIAQTARHFGQNDDITVVSLYFAPSSGKPAVKEKALAS